MTRPVFFPTNDSLVLARDGLAFAGSPVRIWSAQTGGAQLTDLVYVDSTGATLGAVTNGVLYTDGNGLIPAFAGPDGGRSTVWGDHGPRGTRLALTSDPTGTSSANGSAVEQTDLIGYGDSIMVGQGAAAPAGAFLYRVYARRHFNSVANRGHSAEKIAHMQQRVFGSGGEAYGAGAKNYIPLVHMGVNDIRYGDDATSSVTALQDFQNAFPAVLAAFSAGVRYEQSHASFSLGGTWAATNSADTASSGGTRSYASAAGSSYTWTVPSGVTKADVTVQIAYGQEPTIQWSVNGATLRTVAYKTQSTNSGSPGFTVGLERFTGLTAGNTVTATRQGGLLIADVVLVPAVNPPPVFWIIPPRVNWTPTAPTSGSDASQAAFAAYIKSQVTNFPNLIPIDLDVPPSGVSGTWDKATMLSSDGVHPNDKGYEYMARCVLAAMDTLTFPIAGVHY